MTTTNEAIDRLSDDAKLVLLELAAEPRTPITARELAELIATGMSPSGVGQHCRELRTLNYARMVDHTGQPRERAAVGTERTFWEPTREGVAARAAMLKPDDQANRT